MTFPRLFFVSSALCFFLATNSFAQIEVTPTDPTEMHDVTLVKPENMILPYSEIQAPPTDYTAGNLLSRMIDGLGFRYHWVSEGLREEDLAYRPTPEASSSFETLEHIYGLSTVILNGITNQPNIRPRETENLTYEMLRERTLVNLKKASDLSRGMTAAEIGKLSIIFERDGKQSSSPFWHLMNGPLADAIYHTGQIVSFRRTSGNPQRPGVNVFMGTVKK